MLMKGYVEGDQTEFVSEQLSVKTIINQDPHTPCFLF